MTEKKSKSIKFKSTKGGDFSVNLPKNFKKVKLPFFQKWVEALESGKYRQCSNQLCTTVNKKLTYCCLGVLSKIQDRLQKHPDFRMESYCEGTLDRSNPCYDAISNDGRLPRLVSVAIKDAAYELAEHDFKDTVYSLIDCNDVLGLSFKDIAKVIHTVYKK